MSKSSKQKHRKLSQSPRRKRGRPEKPLKIDDTPRNIARSLFGLPPLSTTQKRAHR